MKTDKTMKSPMQRIANKVSRMVRNTRRRRLLQSIAYTPPCPPAITDVDFSPHCLTGHNHLLMATCAAKSLNLACQTALPWTFHEDGSLTQKDKKFLLSHFPGCRLIERSEADDFFENEGLSEITRAREVSVLLVKLADLYAFARHDRILYVDSDVLFFNKPEALLSAIHEKKGNYFTKDIDTAYVANIDTLEQVTGVRPLERVNTGIFVVNRSDIDLNMTEKMFTRIDTADRSRWSAPYEHLIEQTLYAILATSSSAEVSHLPEEYDLYLEQGLRGNASRHYVGGIRELFELEGLQALIKENDFCSRWQQFVEQI